MENTISLIRNFVEGKIQAREFEHELYQSQDMEILLHSDLYLKLISVSYGNQHSIAHVKDELKAYLTSEGHDFESAPANDDHYVLLLQAQPKWVDLTVHDYSETLLKALPDHLVKKEKILWLKEEILKRFKAVKKPPSWLQEPDWPIEENIPLVFLGQLKIDTYFHDTTCVYIFHNPSTGETKNVIQSL